MEKFVEKLIEEFELDQVNYILNFDLNKSMSELDEECRRLTNNELFTDEISNERKSSLYGELLIDFCGDLVSDFIRKNDCLAFDYRWESKCWDFLKFSIYVLDLRLKSSPISPTDYTELVLAGRQIFDNLSSHSSIFLSCNSIYDQRDEMKILLRSLKKELLNEFGIKLGFKAEPVVPKGPLEGSCCFSLTLAGKDYLPRIDCDLYIFSDRLSLGKGLYKYFIFLDTILPSRSELEVYCSDFDTLLDNIDNIIERTTVTPISSSDAVELIPRVLEPIKHGSYLGTEKWDLKSIVNRTIPSFKEILKYEGVTYNDFTSLLCFLQMISKLKLDLELFLLSYGEFGETFIKKIVSPTGEIIGTRISYYNLDGENVSEATSIKYELRNLDIRNFPEIYEYVINTEDPNLILYSSFIFNLNNTPQIYSKYLKLLNLNGQIDRSSGSISFISCELLGSNFNISSAVPEVKSLPEVPISKNLYSKLNSLDLSNLEVKDQINNSRGILVYLDLREKFLQEDRSQLTAHITLWSSIFEEIVYKRIIDALEQKEGKNLSSQYEGGFVLVIKY